MNTDIRVAVGFWHHPKTKRLIREAGFEAVRSLQILWMWAAQNRPDGNISDLDANDIEDAADWNGPEGEFFLAIRERWLDETDDGLFLHEWAEHNPWVADEEDRSGRARLAKLAQVNKSAFLQLQAQGIESITADEYQNWKKFSKKSLRAERMQCGRSADASETQLRNASETLAPLPQAPAPIPAPSPKNNNNKDHSIQSDEPSPSLSSSPPAESEKQRKLPLLLALLPAEYQGGELVWKVSEALNTKGYDYTHSNILYANKKPRENYAGYLCSAFKEDYAAQSRSKEQATKETRQRRQSQKSKRALQEEQTVEEDRRARELFETLSLEERTELIARAYESLPVSIRPQNKDSPLVLAAAYATYIETLNQQETQNVT